jgi:two-component system cell cycle response regulator
MTAATHESSTLIERLKVLVVEDDDDLRSQLKRVVEDMGYACIAASNGEEAWSLHNVDPFDVVLSDWMMPKMDGLELCRKVRDKDGEPYTYFILLTGLADKAHIAKGFREGADEYVTKPVDIDELNARMTSAARVTALKRGLLKENAVLRSDSQRSLRIARIDALTGVGNRLRLSEDLAVDRARALRYGSPSCIALCDVDFFKQYNDHFGHVAGDDVLRRVAGALRENLRGADAIYRYGGEEFLVLLPEQTVASARTAMDRMRHAVKNMRIATAPWTPGGVITISVGIAPLSTNDQTEQAWIRRADMALYRAKSHGRNCTECDGIRRG